MTIRKNGAIIGGLQRADAALDATSTKPIQNKAVKAALDAMAPLSGTTAPTTSTAGNLMQRYLDTVTMKTYTCVGITNTGTEEEPVWSYTWVDDVNAKGGTFTGQVTVNGILKATYGILGGAATGVRYNNAIAFGNNSEALWFNQYVIGVGLTTGDISTGTNLLLLGKFNKNLPKYDDINARITGGGTSTSDRDNIEELTYKGDHFIKGGHQQYITTIPSSTTSYTLREGVQSHIPEEASTYILPWPGDDAFICDGRRFVFSANDTDTGYYGWNSASGHSDEATRYTVSRHPVAGEMAYTDTVLSTGGLTVSLYPDADRTHECILDVLFDAWYRSSSDDGTGYYAWKNNDGGYLYTNSTTITAGTTVTYTDTALTESAGTIALYNAADSAFSMVGTYSFEDVDGNAIAPLSTPVIQPGTVVSFLCRYQDLLKKWCIMPVVQGKLDAPAQA